MSREDRLKQEARVLELAVKHGRLPSVVELAKHFGVSIPTMYQDFQLLRISGLTSVCRLQRSKGCAIEEVLKSGA